MIQFNLLPDVKIQFIKTKRLKRIIIISALAASAVSVVILFFMLSYSAVQKRHLSNLDKDIDKLTAELNNTPDLSKILSVQNQLNVLPTLYNGRPAVERLPQFLDQLTPTGVGIGRLTVDFSVGTMEIMGQANTLELVNSYVDTLKYTMFKTTEEGSQPANAFNGVVLTQFSRDNTEAGFTISMSFDPVIFDITKEVNLEVPKIVTTRATSSPSELFDGSNTESDGEEN